jgi:hypothetical protein
MASLGLAASTQFALGIVGYGFDRNTVSAKSTYQIYDDLLLLRGNLGALNRYRELMDRLLDRQLSRHRDHLKNAA